MHHFFEAITNTAGQSLIGYFARVINPTTQMQVTLASDDAGTPIQVVSGVANMAKTDEFGNLSLYVTPGTYNLDIYGPDAASFLYSVKNVAMNSSKGDPGDIGPAGPADSAFPSLAALQAIDPVVYPSPRLAAPNGSSGGFANGPFTYQTGNFTGRTDVVKIDTVPLSTGALVRQATDGITQIAQRPKALPTSAKEAVQREVNFMDFLKEADRNLLLAASMPSSPSTTIASRLALDTSYAYRDGLNSASTYDPSLGVRIAAPRLPHSILKTIYQRNGQSIEFPGWGAEINFQGCDGPAFVLGKGADGSTDAFGPPCELVGLRSLGSSNTDPLIVVSVPGARLSGLFLTAPNIGIDVRNAADVNITDSTIDQCQLALQISESRNLIVSGLNIFIANEAIRFNSRVYDTVFTGCHINYPKTHGIYFNDGAGDILGLSFNGCHFMMNEQFSSFMAMIRNRASNVQFAMNGGSFRNWKDWAILHDAGVGFGATFNGVQFNGARTDTINYAQSTTSRIFRNGANSEVDFTSCAFANLGGQPFDFTGSTPCSLRLASPRFGGNTGGAAEVVNTNTNPSSRVRIVAPVVDRALVSGAGAALVDVFNAYTEKGWTPATGVGTKGVYERYNSTTVPAAYDAPFAQRISDNLDNTTARVIALEQTLRAHGLIN